MEEDGAISKFSNFQVNDSFTQKATKVRLHPSSQRGNTKNNTVKNNSKISFQFQQYIFLEKADSMTDKDRATVIKLVDEDRRYWLQAAIVRIMKWQKKANFNHLVQEIQKEAGRRFQDLV